jgi:2-dehydro-3-deoxygluconokinase
LKAIVSFGEIMLRLTPFHYQRIEQSKSFAIEYGGSESNVAASLAQFNVPVKYITRVPENSFGTSALGYLAQVGVNTSQCIVGGDRLGIYFVELGSGRRNSKVIYDRTNSSMAKLEPGMIDWKTIFKDAGWFHWSGITPSISHSAAKATAEALHIANEMGLMISCDLNYRSKLWKYGKRPDQVMPELVALSHVIVGDEDVLEVYFKLKTNGMEDAFKKMSTQFKNIKYISFTDRQAFSATHNTYKGYLYHHGNILESKKYDMPDMVDRIGSGDAFMAGLIHKLNQADPELQSTIEFATAAAVYKHYVPGDLNVFTMDDIESIMKGGTGGKVKR